MGTSESDRAGLAWPDHDTGPTPPAGSGRSEDKLTRPPLQTWDRVKFLILLSGSWMVLVWAAMAREETRSLTGELMPAPSFREAVQEQARSASWLLVLLGLEIVRQFHMALSEVWAGYHQFWTKRVFGGFEARAGKLNDWNRYRIARALKWVFIVFLLALLMGKVYDVSPAQGLFRLPAAVWSAMPMVLQLLFLMLAMVLQFVAIFWFLSKGGTDVYFPEDIKTRFTDVWGQDKVVERIQENMMFLENPEAVEAKGGYVPGGILLWGPPGTGKTLMAEAVAGETGKPFVFVDPGAFTNMFIGVGILKVKSLFRKLRKLAVRYGGVIVFFDEADSLGSRGALAQGGWSGGGSSQPAWDALTSCNGLGYMAPSTANALLRSELAPLTGAGPRPPFVSRLIMGAGMGGGGMGTLQALLAELSGLKKPRGFINRVVRRALGMRPKPPPKYRILVIMATNMPQALDEAMLRPGRIDRIYKVGYPSRDGRRRTYEGYLAKVSHQLTPEQIDKLAVITPYATGATIKDMVNEALVVAIRDGREAITWPDIIKAKHLKEHGLPDDTEYIERERHAVAIHEACHAVVAHQLRKHMLIDMATIERRGDIGGFVSNIPLEDQFVAWKSERDTDIMVALASLAGERMFFDGDNSEGVGGDLRSATFLAIRMEGVAGMGSTIGSRGVNLSSITGHQGSMEDGTDRNLLDTEFGRRVESKLGDLYDRTWRLLEENRIHVLALAHALEMHKTMSGDDVAAVIDGTEGPLVDGQPYHEPDFIAALERYHTKAAIAHRGHSPVEAPLPAWSGNGLGPKALARIADRQQAAAPENTEDDPSS